MSSDGKVAFSLGGKKKKKASTSSQAAKDTAAAFGDARGNGLNQDDQSFNDNKPQAPFVIPLSQPTSSLLVRVKQEENTKVCRKKEEETVVHDAPSVEPDAPVVSSGGNIIGTRQSQLALPGEIPKDQFKRDLEQLPDEADEDQYEQVPISQFGAALLRGMGWNEKDDSSNNQKDQGMPRPHRLGLGAIPKAPNVDEHMPSVLSGRNKKKKKLSVQQLQQQEEFERKRELQLKQDKQRTRQVGSIIYINSDNRRAKVVKLGGVPGLNMVLVQFEGDSQPTPIKKGDLGELVARPDLEERPFVVPAEKPLDHGKGANGRDPDKRRRERDRSRSRERRRDREKSGSEGDDGNGNRKRRRGDHEDERGSRRERSRSRSRDRKDDRKRERRRRDRSRSRSKDRKHEEKKSDRRDREKDRHRKRDRKTSKRSRRDDRHSGDETDSSSHGEHIRSENQARKRSRTGEDQEHGSAPLWIIPNIRVRVVTEKLGKKHFRQKGVVVDVNRRHGATLRMEGSGNSIVLEHVPERYLETALPKVGGNAIVLTGSNKWAKGRLLERNSKTSKGAIQVFEDMNILTLPLDDIAEWCGPLDDTLG